MTEQMQPVNAMAANRAAFRPHAGEAGGASIEVPILVQYWHVALRWKWVIGGIIAACLIGGLLLTLLMTPRYTAISRVEISRDQKNVTRVQGVESDQAGRDLEFYQTQYALLEARTLAEKVVKDLKLASNDNFFASHGTSPDDASFFADSRPGRLSAEELRKRENEAVRLLRKHISISPIRGSSLIDISYTSASPTLAAEIANSWTQQFVQSNLDRRFASTVDARKFLEGRLADLRARLEQSERDLVGYAARKDIVTLSQGDAATGKAGPDRTLVSSDLIALNEALAKATAERVAAQSRVSQGAGGASSEALSNQAIAELRKKRADVASEYAKLMVQFEPGYPQARALQEQLRNLDASIAREELRVSSSIGADYGAAMRNEQALRARVDELKRKLGLQERDSIQYNIYLREADTNRQLYDGLLQRYKEIGVAGVAANNISVVDPAKVPEKPSAPSLPFNMALALLAGIGIAGLTTFALEQIDEGLREPGAVNRHLHIPLLGSIPDLGDADAVEELADAKSEVSEAYLSVRSSLAFSTDHGVPRSIMVTSTREAEGKSTTSFALAMVLGRTGQSVLLVDADMRSPSIHKFIGAENQTGLSNCLAGENGWEKFVQQTSIKGLSLMPAGPPPPSAAELLSSDRMMLLVKQMLEKFDHVVIDSAPILGLADAPLLSRSVEGCVFVIEAEGVAMRGVKSALSRLNAVHAHMLGGVMTKLKRRQSGYGYGYGFDYGYGKSSESLD